MVVTNWTYNWYETKYQCWRLGGELATGSLHTTFSRYSDNGTKPLYYIGLRKEEWVPFHHEGKAGRPLNKFVYKAPVQNI